VQPRFDLGPFQEVVGTDEHNGPVRHHAWFVVEDTGERDGMDALAAPAVCAPKGATRRQAYHIVAFIVSDFRRTSIFINTAGLWSRAAIESLATSIKSSPNILNGLLNQSRILNFSDERCRIQIAVAKDSAIHALASDARARNNGASLSLQSVMHLIH